MFLNSSALHIIYILKCYEVGGVVGRMIERAKVQSHRFTFNVYGGKVSLVSIGTTENFSLFESLDEMKKAAD